MSAPNLSTNDWAVLGAVAEGPTHGYAISQLLTSEGPFGRVWTLQRNEVYQVLRKLVGLEMVREGIIEPGNRAPHRTVLSVTPAGRRVLRSWLAEPVDHVRDVRSLLLLKLLLLDRSGRSPAGLIEAQMAKLSSVLEGLEGERDGTHGFDRVVAQWRVTSCRATLEFLTRVGH